MKPRVEEIAGTMPAALGRWILGSPGTRQWLAKFTAGRQIRTRTLGGFLMLYVLGGLKGWRRGTLRFREENARIEAWLARLEAVATDNYLVAVELANAQRLVKGYGETHERGWRNFCTLLEQVDLLASRSDGGTVLARLIEAALADEEGATLCREVSTLRAASQPAPVEAAHLGVSVRRPGSPRVPGRRPS
jgi:indolepyruvate ferredoxin oxidoreductase, beta subunit